MSQWTTSNSAYGAFYKLPPRSKVADPQHALLTAIAPAATTPATAPATAAAPPVAPAGASSPLGGSAVLRNARVVPQPGDGSCLFHSLSHASTLEEGRTPGARQMAEATRLRLSIADFVESQPSTSIAGEPLSEWVKWESGLTPSAYAARMRSPGNWGGAIEIAVFARLFGVSVFVYEPMPEDPGAFRRVAAFHPPHETDQSAALLYRGGVHYDALERSDSLRA